MSEAREGTAQLVRMANDIGHFFKAEERREDAVAGIANHIRKFWSPRMRAKLLALIESHGDAALEDLPREALKSIAERPQAKPAVAPGGDAG